MPPFFVSSRRKKQDFGEPDSFLKHQDRRISLIGGLILAGLTLATGVLVYLVMQRQVEHLLSKSLEVALQSDARLFNSEMNQALTSARLVTSHPHTVRTLELLESEPNNSKVLAELQLIAQLFLQSGFTGFSFYDLRGQEVARAGHFSQNHDESVRLKTKERARLMWDEQFILHSSVDVVGEQGRRIGTVMTEARLPLLTEIFTDVEAIGKTGEFVICAPFAGDEKNMDCFLSKPSGKEFRRLARASDGVLFPVVNALNGKAGTTYAKDYRGVQVVASYAPVGLFGLGMVIKIDQMELYQPLIKQLKFIAPLLAVLVIVGMLLLKFLVRPLVRRLVDSEQAARGANALLRASETQLYQMTDAVPALIAYVDIEQRFRFHNRAYEAAFGLRREQIEGKTLREVMGEELYATVRPRVEEALLGFPVVYERSHKTEEGSNRDYAVSYSPRYGNGDEKEQVIGFYSLTSDITELRRIDRMKSEFISTTSHELRTPLTAIYASLDMLHNGMSGELSPDIQKLLRIAHESTERLVRLVNDVLVVEKIESGRMACDLKVQPLSPLVERAMTEMRAYADQYQVKFELDPGCTDVWVNVDADNITRVLDNLLSNATKFSPQGGAVVRINIRQLPGSVRTSIIDTGNGIPASFRDRIFQRFAQADSSDRREKGGTGLGLNICKKIVEEHQGTIGFITEPGNGCEFYFDLPLAVPVE